MRKAGRKILAGILSVFLLLAVCSVIMWRLSDNDSFETTFYRVTSDKIGEPIRAVLLADLHNSEFGTENAELIEEIRILKPDLILMAGDMVNGDDPNISIVVDLCTKLEEIAPVYYCLGNHEGNLMYLDTGYQIPLDVDLLHAGVHVLYNESIQTEVNGNQLEIGVAATDTENFHEISEPFIQEFEKSSRYKILLSHYPTLYYDYLADADIDLSVAGHFHGGQIRLPGGKGLYHIDTGFFPKYSSGRHQLQKGWLVVSRGLGNHGKIPRINNRPELVVIDISHV